LHRDNTYAILKFFDNWKYARLIWGIEADKARKEVFPQRIKAKCCIKSFEVRKGISSFNKACKKMWQNE
jgi:hypothetical protein